MRVGMAYVGTFGNGTPPVACGVYDYGEVEDYCIVLDPTVSINNTTFNDLTVFPNPTDNYLQVTLDQSIQSIEIINALGQSVLTTTSTGRIDVSNLTSGWYCIRVKSNETIYQSPFWKR